jgi:hypothetical protein
MVAALRIGQQHFDPRAQQLLARVTEDLIRAAVGQHDPAGAVHGHNRL